MTKIQPKGVSIARKFIAWFVPKIRKIAFVIAKFADSQMWLLRECVKIAEIIVIFAKFNMQRKRYSFAKKTNCTFIVGVALLKTRIFSLTKRHVLFVKNRKKLLNAYFFYLKKKTLYLLFSPFIKKTKIILNIWMIIE